MKPRTLTAATAVALVLLACRAVDYPRVDGSTSTHPLSVLIACKRLGVPYEWRQPPSLERTVFPSRRRHPLHAAKIEERVRHHGTHQAYVALIEKKADLILVAREPSVREIEAARRAGVDLEVTPVALDALVFVLNVSNPVDNLPADAIRGIFGPAALKSWSSVGGPRSAIEAFQREPDSGSQELIEKLVMKGIPVRDAHEVPLIRTMAGVVNTVAVRERGIAYSIYYYITNMAPNRKVKMIAIDGVRPTPATIASGEYPLTSGVFAVLRKGTRGPARSLRDWLLSEEGQAAVRESGYVPLPR